jgi:hypothetical protein
MDIVKKAHLTVKEFDRAIDLLKARGILYTSVVEGKKGSKPVVYISDEPKR